MKCLILLASLCLLLFPARADAQLLLDEHFAYDAAALTDAARWSTVRNEDNQYNELKNLTLKFTENTLDCAAYAGSQQGRALSVDFYASTWVSRQMITSFKRQTKGVVYMAFLLRLDQMPCYNNNPSHGTQFATVGLSDSGTSRGPMLWVRKIEQKQAYVLGATLGSRKAEDVVWCGNEYQGAGRTHLVVLKYDLASKSGALFVDPVPGGEEPAPSASIPTQEGAIRAVGSVFLYLFQPKSNQCFSVASIRVATSWAEAAAAK